ncbi:MAG: SusC/RagA family TonB-linked outer membrane protein [Muribaculaceae bacterium]|nr:SusC/RagA family TonB-linked outer membrane protein [Muribaculaceae bacterium]
MKKQFALLAALSIACGGPVVYDGLFTSGFTAVAQAQRATGTVVDETGEPLPGVSVIVAGKAGGVSTDFDGKFSLAANKGDVIKFSYIGYKPAEVKFDGQPINLTLQPDAANLDEVVVTALGIKKDRKALGYSVSEMKSEEILENKSPNVVNALAGKIAGVTVTQYSGAAGAGANITLRGGNSTSDGRSNEPLFVVDGIIYDNSTQVVGNSGTDGMTRSNTTYSNRVMDINPEDIESMSVLKGAAASALYGSRAADGVIIITTKKGAEGTVKVNVSSKVTASWVNKLPEAQTEFGRGYYETNGVFSDQTYNSWGKKITDEPIYDNIGNFFETGAVFDNTVSVSGGSKNTSFFLSASNYNQGGVVPKTGYNKNTFRFNGEQKVWRFTLGANVAYSMAKTDKTLTSGGLYGGGGTGAMNGLYSWPRTEDMSHYLTEDGQKYRLFEGIWSLENDKENPYWIINKDKINDDTKRFTGSLQLAFDITDWWNIVARVGYDDYTTDGYTYIAPGSVVSPMYQNGRLSKSDYRYSYTSTNLMTSINKNVGDFNVGGLVGFTTEYTHRHNQTHYGHNFITPGTISFTNIATDTKFFTDGTSKKRMVGLYGEVRGDWKNTVFLSVTGRNDWSSTLPIENRSYFYPSVNGSVVFTEPLQEAGILDSSVFTFGKVRASWARVGKDANPYATLTYVRDPYNYNGFVGVTNDWEQGNRFLKPEIQEQWEVGAELKFFNNRLGLDYTYYHSETKNQIASPRLSNANGYIFASINSGSVINDGMEIAINAVPVQNKEFVWDLTLNLSYNKGRLGEFLKGVQYFYPTDAQFGTIRSASIPRSASKWQLNEYNEPIKDANGNYIPDATWGKNYFLGLTGNEYYVDEKTGKYEIDPATGLYRVNTNNPIVGNREPKLMAGMTNSFSYKGFNLSFLLDFRLGGAVYNGTAYYMTTTGMHPQTLMNDRQSVSVSGIDYKTGQPYEATYEAGKTYEIGGTTYSGEAMIQNYWSNYASNSHNFLTDVNWMKLRYVSLSYDFTRILKSKKVIKGLTANATASNILTVTNYKGMDPEVSTAGGTGGAGSTGIDYCSVPATSSFTFGVNITF